MTSWQKSFEARNRVILNQRSGEFEAKLDGIYADIASRGALRSTIPILDCAKAAKAELTERALQVGDALQIAETETAELEELVKAVRAALVVHVDYLRTTFRAKCETAISGLQNSNMVRQCLDVFEKSIPGANQICTDKASLAYDAWAQSRKRKKIGFWENNKWVLGIVAAVIGTVIAVQINSYLDERRSQAECPGWYKFLEIEDC